MHGFIKGLPKENLVINANGYLDWQEYKKKFGYISMDAIRNQEAVSKYITKYINKDLSDSVKELNAHLYYCSKGLKTALEIKRGILSANSIPFTFENDYIKSAWTTDFNKAILSIQ